MLWRIVRALKSMRASITLTKIIIPVFQMTGFWNAMSTPNPITEATKSLAAPSVKTSVSVQSHRPREQRNVKGLLRQWIWVIPHLCVQKRHSSLHDVGKVRVNVCAQKHMSCILNPLELHENLCGGQFVKQGE